MLHFVYTTNIVYTVNNTLFTLDPPHYQYDVPVYIHQNTYMQLILHNYFCTSAATLCTSQNTFTYFTSKRAGSNLVQLVQLASFPDLPQESGNEVNKQPIMLQR